VAHAIERKRDMKKQLIRAFVIAALLAASLTARTVWADEPCQSGYILASGEFVCCDDGGCQGIE
jgi:hypothetical protein